MRKFLCTSLIALLLAVMVAPGASAAKPADEETIKATIDAYVIANPLDFEGIDALVYRLRGEHIAVRGDGDKQDLTAAEAAARVRATRDAEAQAGIAAQAEGDVVVLSGIPAPQRYITKIKITNGVQFWGTWDFPDDWAGQGAPVDIASIAFSAPSCVKTQNQAIWTYKMGGGSTGLGSLRGVHPGNDVMWNVADYTTNFTSQADRGTARIEIVRTSACSSTAKNIGAAFWYGGNQGGSLQGVTVGLGFLSITYIGSVHGEWGTDAIYQSI